MSRSYIAQLERIEAGLIPDAWKTKFRKSLIPFMLLYGCGTEDRKEPSQDEDPTEEVDPGSPSSGQQPIQTKRLSKTINEQLEEQGWGCEISLPRSTTMIWVFRKKLVQESRDVRRNIDGFSIVFQKNTDGSWNFSDPKINKNRSGTPEIVALEDEIIKSIKYGAKFIADKYDCAISSPKGTLD